MENDILLAIDFIVSNNLVKGTWGNISIKDKDKIYITPSGIPYNLIKKEDICIVDISGNIVRGKKPSSELPTHLEIYKNRKDINAIVHTHPVYSTIVSLVADKIPPLVEDAVMILGVYVNVAEYALPGTNELANNVEKALGNNNAVILKNHGLITVGSDIYEALTASLVCEKTSEIFIHALSIGNFDLISINDAQVLRNRYLNSYRYLKDNKSN